MNTGQAHNLYEEHAPTMAYIAVEDSRGTLGIGSAFHVGDGVFVSARHVVEGKRIAEIRMTEDKYISMGPNSMYIVRNGTLKISNGPFFHPDSTVDVTVFRVNNIDTRTPYVTLGSHVDNWVGIGDFILSEAIVLGYPPIPFTTRPHLIAARAEINAEITLRNMRHMYFILSAMPRGGFSGGLVITEDGFALGVVTQSLLMNREETELGFFTVLSVEPIYVCLAHHKLLPVCQRDGYAAMWDIGGPPADHFLTD